MSNLIIDNNQTANITSVPPEKLLLDKDNPRLLPESYSGESISSEEDIIRALAQYDLEELLQSIAENGYLSIEPLYVIREGDKYKVLEGNRRLAAIKLFRDPSLARRCGITLPPLGAAQATSLNSILIYETQDEESGWAYIGFKHINGPHKWDSLAKARFILRLYRNRIPLAQISKMIGDTHDTIKKMLLGMAVLEQAASEEIFTAEDRHPSLKILPFSHLYTALTRKEYQQFLGIGKDFSETPVPQDKLENLERVLHWIYGSKKDDRKPVIRSQNPDIKTLGTVLMSTRALSVLATTNDLEAARHQTIPSAVAFKDALVASLLNAKEALGYASDIGSVDKDAQSLSGQLKNTATSIYQLVVDNKEEHQPNQNLYKNFIEQIVSNPDIIKELLDINLQKIYRSDEK